MSEITATKEQQNKYKALKKNTYAVWEVWLWLFQAGWTLRFF